MITNDRFPLAHMHSCARLQRKLAFPDSHTQYELIEYVHV